MTKGAFTPEFTPVGRPGHVLDMDFGRDSGSQLAEIQALVPLPSLAMESVTVANDSTETVELTNLEVWENWIGQFRLLGLADELVDGVTVQADIGGRQAPVWTAKNARGSVDMDTGTVATWDVDGDAAATEGQYTHLTELFVHEGEVPYLTIENQAGQSEDVQLTFSGFMFELNPIDNTDDQPIYVPVQSVRGG